MTRSLQAWAGELVGTFGFITIGAGAVIISTSQQADIGLFGVALAHGLALGALITAFAAISGGHLNPAVTLSAWIGRKISSADALGYVACQVLGALGAGLVLRFMFEESAWGPSNLGSPALTVTTGKGILVEAVLAFVFIVTIWGTGIDERGPRVGGFAIGLVLAGMIMAFGPLTGVSLNPARFIGPAAIAGNVDDWWVYFLGPAIGGTAAGVMYPTLFWGGFPWARIGGSPAEAPDTVSPTPPSAFEETPVEDIEDEPSRPPKRKPARKRAPRKPKASP